jgi:nitrate reductase NapE component
MRRRGMKEAVDRFIETVVVGLFLAPFVWIALVAAFGLVGWLLMVLGLYDATAGPD